MTEFSENMFDSQTPRSEYERLTLAPQTTFDDTIDVDQNEISLRNYFPETWFWSVLNRTTTSLTVPDAITTWVAQAICTNRELGIGIMEPALRIESSKDFFLNFNLPQSITVGETIKLSVEVFVKTEVDCFMLESSISVGAGLIVQGVSDQKKCFCPLEPNNPITFSLTADDSGTKSIEISARPARDTNNLCGSNNRQGVVRMLLQKSDTVKKTFMVKSKGVPKSKTVTRLICPSNEPFKDYINLGSIGEHVKGSEKILVSVIGDLLGPSIRKLDLINYQFLDGPVANGDTSSMNLWSNLLIFEYMDKFGSNMSEEQRRRLLSSIKSAYKTHLDTYLNPYDGSFNEFYQAPYCCPREHGQNSVDKTGHLVREVCQLNELSSSWITATTVRSLNKIEKLGLISLDDQVWSALGWLAHPDKLKQNGCMNTVCYNCETGSKQGISEESLSAFILLTVIELTDCGENKRRVRYKDPKRRCDEVQCNLCSKVTFEVDEKEVFGLIRKAFDCFSPADLRKDAYLATMVFRLSSVYFTHCKMPKHDTKVLRLLDNVAQIVQVNMGDNPFWANDKQMDDSTRIEMTAHILLAINNFSRASKSVETLRFSDHTIQKLIQNQKKIAKWLIEQRNSLGGWIGTADTMAALEAVTDFATLEGVGQRIC